MSEHFITLIPADPYFTPADGAFNKARELFVEFLATAEDTEGRISDEVQFVDQGENFEVCRVQSVEANYQSIGGNRQ